MRHRFVHSYLRLAPASQTPHLRVGDWSINQIATINGPSHCSLVWPQHYYWNPTRPLRQTASRRMEWSGNSKCWHSSIWKDHIRCVCVFKHHPVISKSARRRLWPTWPGAQTRWWKLSSSDMEQGGAAVTWNLPSSVYPQLMLLQI